MIMFITIVIVKLGITFVVNIINITIIIIMTIITLDNVNIFNMCLIIHINTIISLNCVIKGMLLSALSFIINTIETGIIIKTNTTINTRKLIIFNIPPPCLLASIAGERGLVFR